MAREFGIDTSPRTKFVVYNYDSEGGETGERCEVQCDTYEEALDEAACRVGTKEIEPWRTWDGYEPDDSDMISVLGLHSNQKPGCGGVQISKIEL